MILTGNAKVITSQLRGFYEGLTGGKRESGKAKTN